jgi:hypothetical protein
MPTDIAKELRTCAASEQIPGTIFERAANEIERLRKEAFHLAANQCHSGYAGEYGHHRCSEIDRLTAERDEARRECCHAEVDGYDSAENIAKERGWDCFKEDSND